MTTPEAGLGDLVRCAVVLDADDRTARLVARMLGLDLAATEASPPRVSPVLPTVDVTAPGAATLRDPAPEAPPVAVDPEQLELLLPTRTEGRGKPTPWSAVSPLPEAMPGVGSRRTPAPLLAAGRSREILAAIVATTARDGALDVDRAVAEIATGRPLTQLPRRPRRTLRHGVQALVEVGPAMDLFAADRRGLVAELERIVGTPRLRVLRFRDLPDNAGPGLVGTWPSYAPPEPGVPVLVIGDLGIGGAALRRRSPRAWLALARRLARRGSPLVALVPYPHDRWPGSLRRDVAIVRWDRSTTVREVHRTRAGGAR